ncbi:phospholipase D-like domain-containing protein [Peterkaempfera griseoplana]|uniref:phospholipase D-like domain-containing protein n=1 Tax=Peterkaempfera griseoplana TaxID=66896 RepID=UPI0012FF1BE6|nr:phospholipase D-like domain-containing protein [Peterkaempfera griseoplana]
MLADLFGNARDGLNLVAIVPAGLPVTTLSVEVDAQERKDLPLLTETTLRLVQAGVTAPADISGLLGFPSDPVNRTLADSLYRGHLRLDPTAGRADERVRLTPLGDQVANEHAAIQPTRKTMRFYFDQTLREVQPYDPALLIRASQAADEDLLLLPAASTAPVHMDDLTPEKINNLLRTIPDSSLTVLAVRRIKQPRTPRYLPVDLLVYTDPDRAEIQLAVVLDGKLSGAHDIALISLGGADTLDIRVDPPAERPMLDEGLESIRVPVDSTRSHAHRVADVVQPALEAEEQIQVRGVSVFEHPDLLQEALTQATQRVLIMSPWIKKSVVTEDFMNKLESRVRRGIRVDIAYGFSLHDRKCDPEAVQNLEDLAKAYPKTFTFNRLSGTHAKILIFDHTCVTTSFNWLSFQGSKERTYRMEEGNLIRGRDFADAQHAYFLAEIDKHRVSAGG